jgi:hypothetical protein
MEWVLQVADEIDDVIGVLRLASLGLCARISVGISAVRGVVAVIGAGARLRGYRA